jgi:hypothetical protein
MENLILPEDANVLSYDATASVLPEFELDTFELADGQEPEDEAAPQDDTYVPVEVTDGEDVDQVDVPVEDDATETPVDDEGENHPVEVTDPERGEDETQVDIIFATDGADRFDFTDNFGTDVIVGFDPSQDFLNFDGYYNAQVPPLYHGLRPAADAVRNHGRV